jgi:anti-anti-sigma factor
MTAPRLRSTVDEHEAGDARMIDAHGDIDLATVAQLSDALQRAVAGQWNTIVVDLADVTFLGLVGSHPIEDAILACRGHSRRVIVTRPRHQARLLLEWLGLGDSIDCRASSRALAGSQLN